MKLHGKRMASAPKSGYSVIKKKEERTPPRNVRLRRWFVLPDKQVREQGFWEVAHTGRTRAEAERLAKDLNVVSDVMES